MTGDNLQEAAHALQQEMGLQPAAGITEEELLQMLAQRIQQVIKEGPDAFYRLMYRVDIPEKMLYRAINGAEDIAPIIALLIYKRQLQKIQSRLDNKGAAIPDDPDLRW